MILAESTAENAAEADATEIEKPAESVAKIGVAKPAKNIRSEILTSELRL